MKITAEAPRINASGLFSQKAVAVTHTQKELGNLFVLLGKLRSQLRMVVATQLREIGGEYHVEMYFSTNLTAPHRLLDNRDLIGETLEELERGQEHARAR